MNLRDRLMSPLVNLMEFEFQLMEFPLQFTVTRSILMNPAQRLMEQPPGIMKLPNIFMKPGVPRGASVPLDS